MENIDLLDGYINNTLTEKEEETFVKRLQTDPDFSSEFQLYIISVKGIHEEGHQDNIEFGHALKSITKEQLLDIIGKKESNPSASVDSATAASVDGNKVRKPFRIKNWVWQIAGCAAVVGLAFFYVAEMERNARSSMDGLIYELSDFTSGISRGVSDNEIDIKKLDDKSLNKLLPLLEERYTSSEDELEQVENGNLLLMAYIRLHKRQEAKALLLELISKFKTDEEFQGDVNTWETILKYIDK